MWIMIQKCVLIVITTFVALMPSILCAQNVPEGASAEAHRIFENWMSRAETDPGWFRDKWAISDDTDDFSSAYLTDPYVLFMMGPTQVIDYNESGESEILSHAYVLNYAFPMINKGQFIGTLLIIHNSDDKGNKYAEELGEFVRYGGYLADSRPDQRILELRQEYPETSGYVICRLRALRLGNFLLIRRSERTELITPTDRLSGKKLGLEEGKKKGRFSVVSFQQATPLLREAASVVRESYERRAKSKSE